MGDRGNIVIRDGEPGDGDVVFYTHWTGGGVAAVVCRALAKEWRWDDASYLARIVFCELVKGRETEESGYGISRHLAGDRAHPVVVVDADKKEVFFAEAGDGEDLTENLVQINARRWSFVDYVKLGEERATELLNVDPEDDEEKDE
jgi:hypothetical protein